MNMSGNTILITGGGGGIGRALAESFHALDNAVIITGRRQSALEETTRANPGMASLSLDILDAAAIRPFAQQVTEEHPRLNVVIHNAGIMVPETVLAPDFNLETAEATIATNLLGPIRLTAALLPHLRRQPKATIMTVSSGLAFLPLAMTPTYSATKAAIHSYSQCLRYQLKDTAIEVIELAPPYVQTELMGPGQASDPAAMPLKDFIQETIALLDKSPQAREILVERVKPLRYAEVNRNYDQIFSLLNDGFAGRAH